MIDGTTQRSRTLVWVLVDERPSFLHTTHVEVAANSNISLVIG